MAGLPKKYIKKYGVSKKAWREYRKDKGKRSKKSSSSKRTTSTRSSKRVARSRTTMSKQMRHVTGGLTYGAVREPMSDALRQFTEPYIGQIGGEYTDELVMGAVAWYASKGKLPFIPKKWQRQAGYAGLAIESARVGAATFGDVVSGFFGFGGGTTAGTKAGTRLNATVRA